MKPSELVVLNRSDIKNRIKLLEQYIWNDNFSIDARNKYRIELSILKELLSQSKSVVPLLEKTFFAGWDNEFEGRKQSDYNRNLQQFLNQDIDL